MSLFKDIVYTVTILITGAITVLVFNHILPFDKGVKQETQKIIKGFLHDDKQAVREVLEGGKLPTEDALRFLEMYKDQFVE